jgi:hypothetical protein
MISPETEVAAARVRTARMRVNFIVIAVDSNVGFSMERIKRRLIHSDLP